MSQDLSIHFWGAAGTVTGSKHLIQFGDKQILLDCGIFQGAKPLRMKNWEPLPFDPAKLDAVVLSHAHIDHSGALPLIVKHGFEGPIYCTPATQALANVLLRDSAYLQEEHAARANRYGYSKHKPALPLYTMEDAEDALDRFEARPYQQAFDVATGAECTFRCAGHILGSASIDAHFDAKREKRIAFSGDIGRWGRPILRDPVSVPACDALIMESTYGNRSHPPEPDEALAQIVREAAERGGVLLVPAFAVGRTQELVWRLRELEDAGRIPVLPVYIDSPMAIDVTKIYRKFPEDHDIDMKQLQSDGKTPLRSNQFKVCRTVEESKALAELRGPVIIISASGMATGGRILHHLKRRLPERRTTVLLVGFQAYGTRGRRLLEGAESVRIFGKEISVKAHVDKINGLSAHADREELLQWADGMENPPTNTYLVHGEPKAAAAFKQTMNKRKWKTDTPTEGHAAMVN